MEEYYSRKRSSTSSSQGTTTLHSSSHFQRSLSPTGRFCSSSISTRPGPVLTRSTSPTRVSLGRSVSPSSSVKFSAAAAAVASRRRQPIAALHRSLNQKKKTCMCSPTTHPGSFRCSLHKNSIAPGYGQNTASYRPNHQLNMRRSAMTNSLVRIGTVEGDLVRRALAALIRPSSHSLRRREDFKPRPSRLSVMTKAEDR